MLTQRHEGTKAQRKEGRKHSLESSALFLIYPLSVLIEARGRRGLIKPRPNLCAFVPLCEPLFLNFVKPAGSSVMYLTVEKGVAV